MLFQGAGRRVTTTSESSVAASNSSNHPDGRPDIQPTAVRLIPCKRLSSLCSHGCKNSYAQGNRTEFHFSFVYSPVFTELVHRNERNRLRPSTPCATVWIIAQTAFFDCVACYPVSNGFILFILMYLLSAALGTPDKINILVFSSAPRHNVCFGNENTLLPDCQ